MPTSGPTAGQITREERSQANILGFQIVDVTTLPVEQLQAAAQPAGALAALGHEGDVDRLGVGDVIDITIFEVGSALFAGPREPADIRSSANGQTFTAVIDRNGKLSLPYLGSIQAAGLIPVDLAADIRSRLTRLSQSPQVMVSLKENVANTIVLSGTIARPGRQALNLARPHLLDAIAAAGGTGGAAPSDTVVRLVRDGKTAEERLDLIRAGAVDDVTLLGGDRIDLLRQPRTLTVFGAVGRVTQQPFETATLSLAEAIARAGGPTDLQADPSAVFVFRYVAERDSKPIIYRLNMLRPSSYFLAQRFAMRDKDVLYIANARSNQTSKLVAIINNLFTPLFTARAVTR